MERLRRRELVALQEFLRQVYAVRNLDGFVEVVLHALPGLIGSEITTYDEMDPARGASTDKVNPSELEAPAVTGAWVRVMHDHPVLAHVMQTGDGRATKISDLLPQSRFHRSALYNEFYRPILRVEDALCVALPLPPPLVIGVGLHRSRRSFTERDRLLFNLVRPHLTQAHRNAQAFTRVEQGLRQASWLERWLGELGHGAVVLDAEGRVRFATAQARQWFEEYFGRHPGLTGRLPETLDGWVRQQKAWPRSADDAPAPRKPLVVEREGKRLEVRLRSEDEEAELLLEEQPTVMRREPLEALGLTHREAEVLAWVAQGKTNSEVAIILGTRPKTIGKHLERIFSKLLIETRAAATAVAVEAVKRAPLVPSRGRSSAYGSRVQRSTDRALDGASASLRRKGG